MYEEVNGCDRMGSTTQDVLRKPRQALVRRASIQAEIFMWECSSKIRGYNFTH